MTPDLPVVQRDEASAGFFEGTAQGVLVLRHCTNCGRFGPPPVTRCRACHSTALEWRPSEGRGTLVTWTAVHGRPDPDGVAAPAVLGIVELAEGPWMTTRLVEVEGRDLHAGQAFQVQFVRPEGGEALPVFAPA
jgi:uncharacterized protein